MLVLVVGAAALAVVAGRRHPAGWVTKRIDNDDGVHEVETITPTGHHYRSRAPNPPRAKKPQPGEDLTQPEQPDAA